MVSVQFDVDALSDPAVVFDDSGRVLDCNEAVVDVAGVQPGSEGATAKDLFDDGDAERVERAVGRVAETGGPAEEAVVTAGEKLEFTFSEIPDGEGDVLAIGRSIVDSEADRVEGPERPERERSMTEIRTEERERYETLVEQSSDGVAVVADGRFVFANDRFVEITGYDRETLLGMPFQEVFAPEYRDVVTRRYERRIADESPPDPDEPTSDPDEPKSDPDETLPDPDDLTSDPDGLPPDPDEPASDSDDLPPDQYDVEVETADGERLTLELAVSRIRHEGEPATMANFRDVTARRRRERAIRALQDATERMQAAETAESVARMAVEAAKDVLGLPMAICWFHDPGRRRLEPVVATDLVYEQDLVSPLSADRYEYDVFRKAAATTYTPSEQSGDNPLETGILLPLGDHGLLGVGRLEETEYDEVVFGVARTLAEHATTALDRVERAKEVRENERRFRAIFNGTYQFMGLLEPDGTVVEANDAALEFGEFDQADVLGEKLWETEWFQHAATTRREARQAVERAADGEFVRHELTVQGGDREAVIDFSIRPVTDEDGEVTLLIPEGRDITELKEREVELKRERDHVRRTEELAEVGGWELDLQTEQLRWTEGTRHIYELPDGYQPTLDGLIGLFHPEDRESVRAGIDDCRRTGMPFELECRIVTAKGRTRWVHLKGDRLTEDVERKLRGVVRDITERKEREQRLMVSSRVVRHNIRNKLSLVRGYAEQLETDLAALDLPADVVESLLAALLAEGPPTASDGEHLATGDERTSDERTSEEFERLRRIVEGVAEFPAARARTHLRRIQRTADDLVALGKKIQRFERVIEGADFDGAVEVGPLLTGLGRRYGRRYPGATVEVDDSDAVVHGTEAVLALAIGELLENGIRHSGHDEPTVHVDVEQPGDGQVRIHVADDGPGIPEMEREVLTKGEETPMLHGSGVGLWTVNWLMTRIGGRISIADDDPHGTVVTLTIPTVGGV